MAASVVVSVVESRADVKVVVVGSSVVSCWVVVVSCVVENVVDSSLVVSTVVSTIEVSVVVSSAVVLASSVKVSCSTVEDLGSISSVLESSCVKVLESDGNVKVLKGTNEDWKVSGGGWEVDIFDHRNVVDGLGTIMGRLVVTTPFGRVVTIGGSVSPGRVVTTGGASSEDVGATMIGPRDDRDGNCWAWLVAIAVEVAAPSWQSWATSRVSLAQTVD